MKNNIIRDLVAFATRREVSSALQSAYDKMGDEDCYVMCTRLLGWILDQPDQAEPTALELDLSREFPRLLRKTLLEEPALACVFVVDGSCVELSPQLSTSEKEQIAAFVREHYEPCFTYSRWSPPTGSGTG